MTSWQQGTLFAICTAFCWTISSVSFESASRRAGSLPVNLIRLVMAFFFMSVWCWVWRGLPLPTDAPRQSWLWLSISGLVGFFVGDLALFRAFVMMGARLSSLAMSLAPPITAVIGYLVLGETIHLRGWIGMGVTLLGIGWVVTERMREENHFRLLRQASVQGVILCVIGALGQAVGLVLAKKGMITATGDYDPVAATQIRALAGIAGFAGLIVATGAVSRVVDALRHRPAMGFMTLGALAGPFAGVCLLNASIQLIPTGVAQTITATVPVLLIPLVIVLYNEHVSWRAGIGAVITVIGVAMLVWTDSSPRRPAEVPPGKDVQMQMEHRLPGPLAAVKHGAVVLVPQ
jgi:drug/metabolite transporter (DMT)-like permease